MRRLMSTALLTAGLILIASPAQAFAHNRVTNPALHAVLDLLTLAVVLSPIVTARLWGPTRRRALLALIAVVQLPVAIVGFVPIINPGLHLALFLTALGLTAGSLWTVRRAARPQAVQLNASQQ